MGQDVLKSLIQATGISEELISPELKSLTDRAGLSAETLTIEDLRLILAEYVQEVLLSAKEQFDSQNSVEKIEAVKASILPLDA